ncbi:YrhB domain-containing protein [Streptomyces sp. NPDC056405]|uniref:YrhB domain-containing protein n=1 Tax=Streptomyces sp. NPDC056405 TaxID=3345811 RepID=UPI0035DB2720
MLSGQSGNPWLHLPTPRNAAGAQHPLRGQPGLAVVLTGHVEGDVIRHTEIFSPLRALDLSVGHAVTALEEMGIFEEDSEPSFERWLVGRLNPSPWERNEPGGEYFCSSPTTCEMLPDMIDRDFAIRVAQEDLDRRYSGRLAVTEVEKHELVWIVYYQSAEYLRTGDPGQLLGGNGPYLVDRLDGSLHQIGPVTAVTGDWELDYRTRVRKMTRRSAVDDLHEEVRRAVAASGRIIAMHLLRQRIPTLTHAQVIEYVTALQVGAAPPHLAAIATSALVPAIDPVLGVHTIHRAGSTPSAESAAGGGPLS